jgi:hypothetical protein
MHGPPSLLQFEEIRETYELIIAMFKEEEEERKYEWTTFDADVIKVQLTTLMTLRARRAQLGV